MTDKPAAPKPKPKPKPKPSRRASIARVKRGIASAKPSKKMILLGMKYYDPKK